VRYHPTETKMRTDHTKRQTAMTTVGLFFATAMFGCGGMGKAQNTVDARVEAEPDGAGGTCNAVVAEQVNGGHIHVSSCSDVTYASNPPSSGNHYPTWAKFKAYSAPVPWGFLVHSLEHGAVVMVYNCPEGCADEVAQAQSLMDGLAPDANCAGAKMKIILAPDPTLDVRWAASAWTWTLRAPCLDRQSFTSFIADHYQGPDTEDECSNGADLSATGWCP